MNRLSRIFSKLIVNYAHHLKEMDDMKANHELRLATLKSRRILTKEKEESNE